MYIEPFRKVTIIIPAYNEESTIKEIVEKVKKADTFDLEKEIIIVDDASTDKTGFIAKHLEGDFHGGKIIYVRHEKNKGKGAAIRTALSLSSGDIILIQDADLEYDPEDYPKLLKPILSGETNVVYGTRLYSSKGELKKERFTYLLHYYGNLFLTKIVNILFPGAGLTDMETCYKVFTRDVAEKVKPLESDRFEIEPELTIKILKSGEKIKEVPINYYSRSFREGKKINWRDGIKALITIIKFWRAK